jgi:hypothetical protein
MNNDHEIDYFKKYIKGDIFDISSLINDDFFQPVRILYNAKHYVSALKLLLIAIDSIGYIEYGEIKENTFIKWLNEFSDIQSLDITSEELWEQRNSLLHMSNLDSRKVQAGKTRRLIGYVGELPENATLGNNNTGYFEIYKLIVVIGNACGNWLDTFNKSYNKINDFVKRYDLIASDARMIWIKTN